MDADEPLDVNLVYPILQYISSNLQEKYHLDEPFINRTLDDFYGILCKMEREKYIQGKPDITIEALRNSSHLGFVITILKKGHDLLNSLTHPNQE